MQGGCVLMGLLAFQTKQRVTTIRGGMASIFCQYVRPRNYTYHRRAVNLNSPTGIERRVSGLA